MSLKKQIEEDLKAAIRAQNKDEIRGLRGIKSLILLSETEKGSSGKLSEEGELRLLSKASKQRKDSAKLFADQGREDLASVEISELAVIKRYLPEQLSEQELEEHLIQIIKQVNALGPQDMGKVMGAANKSLKGKADGSSIAKVAKALLVTM